MLTLQQKLKIRFIFTICAYHEYDRRYKQGLHFTDPIEEGHGETRRETGKQGAYVQEVHGIAL